MLRGGGFRGAGDMHMLHPSEATAPAVCRFALHPFFALRFSSGARRRELAALTTCV